LALAVVAATAGLLLALQPWSRPLSQAAPTPFPSIGAPVPASGEPPILPGADCTGGSSDRWRTAAAQAVCSVLTPLAAMDAGCSPTPGLACTAAARQLSRAANSALHALAAVTPSGAAETSAAPQLRTALQGFVKAGDNVAGGIDQNRPALQREGMTELSRATAELTAAGAALSGPTAPG
jgi:hypothetical protein